MHPLKRGLIHVINWLYIWLPRFTGCHRRADRSFHLPSGLAFPVCARCTGELAGMLLACCIGWLGTPPLWVLAVMLLPLVADGFLQLLTRYESTNPRRFWTGLLFGYALVMLTVWFFGQLFRFGVDLGHRLAAQ